MEALAIISRALLILVFTAIAVVSFRHWRRQRDRPTLWVFVSFSLLASLTVTLALIPDESSSDAVNALRRVALAALPVFPYALFRVTAAMAPVARPLERIALALTVAVVPITLALPGTALSGDEGGAWFAVYIVALLVQWSVLSIAVAVLLWRGGRRQTTVARRRMRTLSVVTRPDGTTVVLRQSVREPVAA